MRKPLGLILGALLGFGAVTYAQIIVTPPAGGGGNITCTAAAGQVLYATGATTCASEAAFAYDTVTNTLTAGTLIETSLPNRYIPFSSDGALVGFVVQSPPSGAESITPVLAGTGAGNLSNGTYSYKFTFITIDSSNITGETTGSTATAAVTVVNNAANGKVTIPDLVDFIQTVQNADIQGVNIYRTAANGATYRLVGAYNDAAFTDNVADGSLGAVLPTSNTTQVPGPILNNPNVVQGPSTLLQQNLEVIAFNNATSKIAVGSSITLSAGGWQPADASMQYVGASLALYGAGGPFDGQIQLTARNASIDQSGNAGFLGLITAGGILVTNGKALQTDTTTAHTLLCQAYDVDGAAYKTFCTATNGNTPSWDWSAPAGGSLTGNFTSLQVNSITLSPSLSGTTGSIGGGALLAGACASGTVAVTNSTTSMTVTVSPNTYPGDGTDFYGYVSSNGTVTVKVCALVAVTPTSSTYNVRVIQ